MLAIVENPMDGCMYEQIEECFETLLEIVAETCRNPQLRILGSLCCDNAVRFLFGKSIPGGDFLISRVLANYSSRGSRTLKLGHGHIGGDGRIVVVLGYACYM